MRTKTGYIITKPLLIQKEAQTFLSVVFGHPVLRADKNIYPPFKLFYDLIEISITKSGPHSGPYRWVITQPGTNLLRKIS